MSAKDSVNVIIISASPEKIYKAITEEIDRWWTALSNNASNAGDALIVRFEGSTKWTMTVTQTIPNQSLDWAVIDAHHDLADLNKKDEWKGTTIQWEIEENEIGSKVTLTHQGLVPQLACFDICHAGWRYFLGSLKAYMETGKGNPFKVP